MFKKVVGFEAVPHRMGSTSSKRDPLLDEKIGSAKRHKASDRSDVVHYKETEAETKARRRAERAAEKGERGKQKEAEVVQGQVAKKSLFGDFGTRISSFKEKLKASSLPGEAALAEQKHKTELEAEKEKALAKSSLHGAAAASAPATSSSAATAPRTPDEDERLSFADIWKEGEEESSSDWLSGRGLKFHTTADKAFSMDSKRFKEVADARNSVENMEAAAERARKQGEAKMRDFRRSHKG